MELKPNMTRAEIESAASKYWRVDDTTIFSRCLDTFFIALDARDASLTDAIKDHGYWESWVTAWHTKHVKPGTLYIDGGANCGYYSFLASYLGAKVWAFEPNERYVSLIRKARFENELTSKDIAVFNSALSESNGFAKLNFFDNFDGSASIVADTGTSVEVTTMRLDSLIGDYITDGCHDILLKLDIEGAEELALRGAVDLIAKNNVTILLEYTPGAYSDDFWHLLESFGKVYLVDYQGNETAVTRQYAESQTDWITLAVHSHGEVK